MGFSGGGTSEQPGWTVTDRAMGGGRRGSSAARSARGGRRANLCRSSLHFLRYAGCSGMQFVLVRSVNYRGLHMSGGLRPPHKLSRKEISHGLYLSYLCRRSPLTARRPDRPRLNRSKSGVSVIVPEFLRRIHPSPAYCVPVLTYVLM